MFVTELVAFMRKMGYAKLITPTGKQKKQGPFFSFKREAFGVVHLAFNKERMLVFTHSGKRDLKEAYAFCVGPKGEVECEKIRQC